MNKTAKTIVCAVLAAGVLAGCGEAKIDRTLPAITVDDETVSLGEAEFYLRAQQAETQKMMETYGFMSGTQFWDQSTTGEDGKETTYGQQIKDSIRDELAQYLLLRRHAADYDLEMPEEVSKAAAEAAKALYESNTDVLEELGTTEEEIQDVLVLSAYPDLMKDAMTADVDLEVSDEEAAQCRVVYARIREIETDENGNESEASDETIEAYRASLEQLLADIQEAGEVDEDKIRELADAIDEEHIMVGSTSYGKDDQFLPEEVTAAAETLQDGETYDEVIETSQGYLYLIHMVSVLDRDATDLEKQSIASQRQQEAYDAIVQEWMDGAEISTGDNWNSLTVLDSEPWRATTAETP